MEAPYIVTNIQISPEVWRARKEETGEDPYDATFSGPNAEHRAKSYAHHLNAASGQPQGGGGG